MEKTYLEEKIAEIAEHKIRRYKMIVYVTLMEDIPKNCNECKMEMCRLPLKENGYELLKKYLTKRHKECPLIEIEE